MNIQTMSPNQIRKVGLEVLAKALGPVGMVRFLQQFETGSGDYTRERDKWTGGMGVQDIVKGIEKQRSEK